MLPNLRIFHKYPQTIWAKEIIDILKKIDISPIAKIVDAPCGNGIIAYFVKKVLKHHQVVAYDLDAEKFDSPYFKDSKVPFEAKIGDVYKEKLDGSDNIWLLINSLYCLPDNSLLIERNRSQFKYIIAVFPIINSSNYHYFIKNNPSFKNPSAMSIESTIDFFNEQEYRLLQRKAIIKIPFHIANQNRIIKMFPNSVKNLIYNMFDLFYLFGNPHYEILTFIRHEKSNIVVRL